MSDTTPTSLTETNISGLQTNQANIGLLWKLGLAVLQLSLVGSLFVAFRIFLRWRKSSLSSLAQRLPLYFSILDLIQYGLYSTTTITVIISGSLPSGESCRVIGGFIFFVGTLNVLMVGLVAFVTYLRICRNYYFDFGEYDWRLHFSTILSSAIATSLFNSEFGADIYWCYVKRTSIVVPLINSITFFISLLISAVCYTCVILALRRATSILPSSLPENFENQVYKKIISYVLMFLLNWVLAFPYMLSFIYGGTSLVVFYLCMISCHWGGMLNAIAFIYNEGFWSRDKSPWKGTQFKEHHALGRDEPPRNQWQLSTERVVIELEKRKSIDEHGYEPKNSRDSRWWQKPDEVVK